MRTGWNVAWSIAYLITSCLVTRAGSSTWLARSGVFAAGSSHSPDHWKGQADVAADPRGGPCWVREQPLCEFAGERGDWILGAIAGFYVLSTSCADEVASEARSPHADTLHRAPPPCPPGRLLARGPCRPAGAATRARVRRGPRCLISGWAGVPSWSWTQSIRCQPSASTSLSDQMVGALGLFSITFRCSAVQRA